MIKNVVFDIGMVLKGWHPENLCQEFGEEKGKRVIAAIWGTGYWDEMDLGVQEEEVLLEKMIQADPGVKDQILYTWNHLELVSEKYDYPESWIETLHQLGYKVFYLSNYSRRLRKEVPQTIAFTAKMDGGIYSSDVRLMKPDRAIYDLLCTNYGLAAEECLFLDDRQENVNGAIRSGMKSLLFVDYETSYDEIMEYLRLNR